MSNRDWTMTEHDTRPWPRQHPNPNQVLGWPSSRLGRAPCLTELKAGLFHPGPPSTRHHLLGRAICPQVPYALSHLPTCMQPKAKSPTTELLAELTASQPVKLQVHLCLAQRPRSTRLIAELMCPGRPPRPHAKQLACKLASMHAVSPIHTQHPCALPPAQA